MKYDFSLASFVALSIILILSVFDLPIFSAIMFWQLWAHLETPGYYNEMHDILDQMFWQDFGYLNRSN